MPEERTERARIRIVDDVKPRTMITSVVTQRVPTRSEKRFLQCDRPQPGTANPEHDHIIEGLRNTVGQLHHLSDTVDRVRQVEKPEFPSLMSGHDPGVDPTKALGEGPCECCRIETSVNVGRNEIAEVKANLIHHPIRMVRPS